jgi:anaerobic ribonucleoside-triphosphate reductase activating protein
MIMCDDYKVLTITHPDVENGTGCRVTIWASGCPHHCPGCHNKHTWEYGQGKNIFDVKEQIFEAVDKPYIKGITLSGGDPMGQSFPALQQLEIFIDDFKKEFPDKDIWIYSGDTIENLVLSFIKKRILMKCDYLVDGPFIQEQYDPDLEFRGSSNQRIINLKEWFEK